MSRVTYHVNVTVRGVERHPTTLHPRLQYVIWVGECLGIIVSPLLHPYHLPPYPLHHASIRPFP